MSTFAPKETTPPSGIHPEDEELAAYIDGMLGREEADRITEHLAACADCYHIYAETVEFQSNSKPPNVVHFPEKKVDWMKWTAVAALVVVGIGIGWFVFQHILIERPELTTAELLPTIQSERSVEDLAWSYAVHRGGVGDEELMRQSFQVGALLVDFQLRAQAGGDLERAKETWRTIGRVVQGAPLMKEDGVRIFNQAEQIESVEDLRRLASSAPATEAALGGDESVLFPEFLDFGKWTEAGSVSAKLRRPSFFQQEENRQFLSYLLSWKGGREMALGPEVQELLQKIEQIWDGGPLDEKDFEALAANFKAILDRYDFQPSTGLPY